MGSMCYLLAFYLYFLPFELYYLEYFRPLNFKSLVTKGGFVTITICVIHVFTTFSFVYLYPSNCLSKPALSVISVFRLQNNLYEFSIRTNKFKRYFCHKNDFKLWGKKFDEPLLVKAESPFQ